MNVYFVDTNGTPGVVQNDLSVESEEPVSEEVRLFLEEKKSSRTETSVTVCLLMPGFLIELYSETAVRKVEPVSTESE